jgi:hypothetical protein
MTSAALKLYTAATALICAGAIAWSIHQSSAAATWQAEAGKWQTVAQQTVVHDRHTVHRYRTLARRYNQIVVRTRRSQQRLLAGLHAAQPVAVAQVPSVSSVTPVATASAPPVATASAPTTHTS